MSLRESPVLKACHPLVTSIGKTRSAIAILGSKKLIEIARLTMGKARPVIPLIIPPAINATAINPNISLLKPNTCVLFSYEEITKNRLSIHYFHEICSSEAPHTVYFQLNN